MTDDEQRRGPPPVEPMSDVTWARVERGLWSRMDAPAPARARRGHRWLWIGAPALAAAALAVVVGTRGGDPTAIAPDQDPVRLVSGGAPSSVTIGDAHVTLDAETAVVMSRDDVGPSALVERGAAWFAIAPRTGRPFIVAAGDATVRVIGTRFRVARSLEIASVEVAHGIVEVTFRGRTLKVGAGERWSSARPSEVVAVRTAQADREAPAVVPVETEPTERPGTRRRDGEPAPDRNPVKIEPNDKPYQDEYERLQRLEPRNHAAAMDGYIKLSRVGGPWGDHALYAAGRLAHDRGDSRAKTLLQMYLMRAPSGRNAPDARKLLDIIKGAP